LGFMSPSDDELAAAINAYLEDDNLDLDTVSLKQIRKAMEAKFKLKLNSRKDFLKKEAVAAMERIEKEREKANGGDDGEDEQESSEEDEPIRATHKKSKKPSKAEVTTFEENGVFYSRSGRPQRSGAAKRQIASQIRKSRKRTGDRKENGGKKKRTGFSKLLAVTSEGLRDFLETDSIARHDAVKKIWQYCKDGNMKNENDGREMILDERLQDIFKVKKFTYFKLQKYLTKHLKDPDLC